MPTVGYNKRFEPKYDNDLIPNWYFKEKIEQKLFLIGEVKSYTGAKVPDGWLLCDGAELSRNHYVDLFNVIGTTYGEGDGLSTFELPTYEDETSVLGFKIIKI